jgi:putative transposase
MILKKQIIQVGNYIPVYTTKYKKLFLYINNSLYICAMRLVEQHTIKQSSVYYNELSDLLHKCKNLYNKGLYVVRQHYFQYKDDNTVKYKYLNYYSLEKKLRTEDDVDYRALPSPVAQQVLMMVDRNFKSFFNLLNKKNRGEYSEFVRMPKYLSKDGLYLCIFLKLILPIWHYQALTP